MAKFCPECGASAEGKKFCPECGTALAGDDAGQVLQTPAAAPAVEEEERELWSGQPDRVFASVGERSSKYILTTERLRVDSGVMRKKAESLDLWRIKDVSVKKSMTQRTRKCGDVEIVSADASTPKLTLSWIQNPDEVAEQIRNAVRASRKRHGTVTQERF